MRQFFFHEELIYLNYNIWVPALPGGHDRHGPFHQVQLTLQVELLDTKQKV